MSINTSLSKSIPLSRTISLWRTIPFLHHLGWRKVLKWPLKCRPLDTWCTHIICYKIYFVKKTMFNKMLTSLFSSRKKKILPVFINICIFTYFLIKSSELYQFCEVLFFAHHTVSFSYGTAPIFGLKYFSVLQHLTWLYTCRTAV